MYKCSGNEKEIYPTDRCVLYTWVRASCYFSQFNSRFKKKKKIERILFRYFWTIL